MVVTLDRQIYLDAEAARLVNVPLSTFRRWLDGAARRDRFYAPILRPEPTGSHVVTWGEFVEAFYLREYRKVHAVRLDEIRRFVRSLRDLTGVPYPLAHHRPWVGDGKRLLIQAQTAASLDPELWSAFSPTTGDVLLTARSESFLSRVSWHQEVVATIHPQGEGSPVTIDPDLRFGAPSVKGVSTEAIVAAVNAGDSVEAVAGDYGLNLTDVAYAITFESQSPSGRAA